MKKILALLLCAMCVFSLAACGDKTPVEQTETDGSAEMLDGSGELVGMVNPFVSYGTLEEACEVVGFDFSVPDEIEGYPTRNIQIMDGKMLQVTYINELGEMIILRKAAGSEDISGDYTIYGSTKNVALDSGVEAEARGDDELFSAAVWTAGDYTYAVDLDNPMDEASLLALLNGIDTAD
jgi:hypothetical protein